MQTIEKKQRRQEGQRQQHLKQNEKIDVMDKRCTTVAVYRYTRTGNCKIVGTGVPVPEGTFICEHA